MIDEGFIKIMRSKTGCAVVMAGSGSDKEHIGKVVESLRRYEVPFRVRICSAHKQPDKLMKMVGEYNKVGGLAAYVAIAGGTDALSGTLSFHAYGPVINSPPDAPNESCLTNPPGSSNACVERAGNVGKLVAQMYAGVNPRFNELLEQEKVRKIKSLDKADVEFQGKYGGR